MVHEYWYWTIPFLHSSTQDRTVWKIPTSHAASADMHDADW